MSITLGELAARIGAKLVGDAAHVIDAVADLEHATGSQLVFVGRDRYLEHLATTAAGAVLLRPADAGRFAGNRLLMDNPQLGFARAAAVLHAPAAVPGGVQQGAVVDPAVAVPASCHIGPAAVVLAGTRLGERVYIGPGAVVGPDVEVGDDCRIHANVTLYPGTRLGRRCTIFAGAVLGADGFGFVRDGVEWVAVPQLGGVMVGDDVSIGANSTVDRGTLGDTFIDRGVKIDNLVQVAHNVHIGEYSILAGCVAIAGSSRIGRRCLLGGRVGVVDHVEIADDVQVMATTLVTGSIRKPGIYSSVLSPDENKAWRRNAARFRSLDELYRRVRKLESGIASRARGEEV